MVKRGLLLAGVIALFAALLPLSVHADETASSTFSIDVSDAALQVTAPDTANIILDPASSKFFGNANITLNVATNNMTGYTMTMSVPTTDLTHTEITGNNAPIIPTLQSAAPESTFPANTWGYKVLGDNYNPVQFTNTNPSWQTDGPTNGTDHIIGLAAKVDGVKHSGIYKNTLTFNVVANPTSARDIITFDANGGTGNMNGISVYSGDTVTLPDNTFTAPAGYRFSGWSAVRTDVSPTQNMGVYANKAAYTVGNTNINRRITLYAQWTNLPCGDNCNDPQPDPTTGAVGTTIARAYEIAYTAQHKGMYEKDESDSGDGKYHLINSWPPDNEQYHNYDVRFAMQDMTSEICDSVTVLEDPYGALDIRDDSIYEIVKLRDGRCWMREDLALDLTDEATQNSMNGTNTNAPAAAVANLFNNNNPQVEGWSTPKVVDVTELDLNGNAPKIITAYEGNIPDSSTGWKTGIMYNYCAVSAGTYCFGSGQNVDISDTLIDSPHDICPTGWRLPTGDIRIGEINALTQQYSNISTNAIRALHLVGSGYFNYHSLLNETTTNYWTSTYYSTGGMRMYYYWGWQTNHNALTVRCIAK